MKAKDESLEVADHSNARKKCLKREFGQWGWGGEGQDKISLTDRMKRDLYEAAKHQVLRGRLGWLKRKGIFGLSEIKFFPNRKRVLGGSEGNATKHFWAKGRFWTDGGWGKSGWEGGILPVSSLSDLSL